MYDRSGNERLSRRRVLALLGAGGLAGCTGADSDDDIPSPSRTPTTGGRSTTPTTVDETATATVDPPVDPVDERYDLSTAHGMSDWGRYDPEWEAPDDSPPELQAEVLIENLEIPWDLSFAGDGTLFLTERVGRIRAFDGEEARVVAEPAGVIDAEATDTDIEEVVWWVEGGEGGTLGIAAHPGYPEPPVVYVYYTAETADGRYNRVAAMDVSAENPSETTTVIVDRIPSDTIHNGGRIAFGPEKYLWVTCGDAAEGDRAQDPSTLNGKVLRVTPAGDPAPDNPDHGGDPRVFTYGHRNPQGIVWLPDGTPVASEHGASGRDEVNRLEPGANYGWPDVRRREEYLDAPDIHRPLANTGKNAWAPTGSVFYTGEAVPGMQNRMLIGGLYSQQLTVATLTPPDGTLPPVGGGTRHDGEWSDGAYTATVNTVLEDELGRVRHVEQGPDGDLYAITSNRDGRAQQPFPREGDDVLVRLTTA